MCVCVCAGNQELLDRSYKQDFASSFLDHQQQSQYFTAGNSTEGDEEDSFLPLSPFGARSPQNNPATPEPTAIIVLEPEAEAHVASSPPLESAVLRAEDLLGTPQHTAAEGAALSPFNRSMSTSSHVDLHELRLQVRCRASQLGAFRALMTFLPTRRTLHNRSVLKS